MSSCVKLARAFKSLKVLREMKKFLRKNFLKQIKKLSHFLLVVWENEANLANPKNVKRIKTKNYSALLPLKRKVYQKCF